MTNQTNFFSVYRFNGEFFIKCEKENKTYLITKKYHDYKPNQIQAELTFLQINSGYFKSFETLDDAIEAVRSYLYQKSFVFEYPNRVG